MFLEFATDGVSEGRVEFELFPDCPKTAENFLKLCTGVMGIGLGGLGGIGGRHLHYKGSKIHRIKPGFMI